MPALSKDGANAAFHSDTFRPDGVTRLRLRAHFRRARRAPFFHCHGLWTEACGRSNGGHMMPDETVVAEPFEVSAFGTARRPGRARQRDQFQLFGPVGSARAGEDHEPGLRDAAAANQDFAGALEGFCREHGILRARLHGGVG